MNVAAVVVLAPRAKRKSKIRRNDGEVWRKSFKSLLSFMHMFKKYTHLIDENNTVIWRSVEQLTDNVHFATSAR